MSSHFTPRGLGMLPEPREACCQDSAPVDIGESIIDNESILAAEGKLRLPAKAMSAQLWRSFRLLQRPNAGGKGALGALIADRDEEG